MDGEPFLVNVDRLRVLRIQVLHLQSLIVGIKAALATHARRDQLYGILVRALVAQLALVLSV